MEPVWLIEAGVYRDEIAPLLDALRWQQISFEVIGHQALRKGNTPTVAGNPLPPDACVIGYGTYPFAQQILLHHKWTPGAWCSAVNLDCACYYAHVGRFLLNQHYTILPGVEAIRQQDWLYRVFGVGEQVFARPTSCHKLFVGRCIERDAFSSALAPTRYDPTTLVVIASPLPIQREWRLVVVEDRVVAGSQYAMNGQRALSSECPSEVMAFAETILREVRWRPDPVFMLDVCESGGKLWLVELNSFSGSWLYQCDYAAVVSAVNAEAKKVWAKQHPEL